ncbi:uncharacterized protein [Ranitomeya imitator]|uniref:uncharacterized protein n=1 Tax=Ranitomeya imitator TaxID=111125 RepID=UPI0037E7B75B
MRAQSQHLKGWAHEGSSGAVQRLMEVVTKRKPVVQCLEDGSLEILGKLHPTVLLIRKLWSRLRHIRGITDLTKYSPLWHNNNLKEFEALGVLIEWLGKGIQYVYQIIEQGELKSFSQLQAEFGLGTAGEYQYLQMRHAFGAQSRDGGIRTQRDIVLEYVCNDGTTGGVIPTLYKDLLHTILLGFPIMARAKWERDLGQMDNETWELVLEWVPRLSLSEPYRMSQLYVIHRVYKSPMVLYKAGLLNDSECPRCKSTDADIFHMMWTCPRLAAFWVVVLSRMEGAYGCKVPREPVVCLLGCVDEIGVDNNLKIAIARLLYMARKVIARNWIREEPPSRGEFLQYVKQGLTLEKGIYKKRGKIETFNKLWSSWIASNVKCGLYDRLRD